MSNFQKWNHFTSYGASVKTKECKITLDPTLLKQSSSDDGPALSIINIKHYFSSVFFNNCSICNVEKAARKALDLHNTLGQIEILGKSEMHVVQHSLWI